MTKAQYSLLFMLLLDYLEKELPTSERIEGRETRDALRAMFAKEHESCSA